MIVDPATTALMAKDDNTVYDEHGEPMQAPPSYDTAVGGTTLSGQYVPEAATKAQDVKVPPPSDPYSAGQPLSPQAAQMPATVVYNYINPTTGERIVSLLPPDHPQMVCLQQGGHVPRSKYGILGVLAAIFWFPLGIGLCLLDRKVYCERCGVIIDEGVC
ncbi:hypothetical protein C8Q70DRAFT_950956 [Cubamyces menziesii]|nr:hypothetical protein C8Q70DRAFT_950956 [Cubamyces menziesii]